MFFLFMNDLIIIVDGLCTISVSFVANVKDLEGIFVVDSTVIVVSKVTTRNATSGCFVLVHNTKFFKNSVRYACVL
jgi:hypothetical protein